MLVAKYLRIESIARVDFSFYDMIERPVEQECMPLDARIITIDRCYGSLTSHSQGYSRARMWKGKSSCPLDRSTDIQCAKI